MNVLLYDLPNPPHHDGQNVLLVRDGDYELQAVREGEGFWLYTFVMKDGKRFYIRMVRPPATVEKVRHEGRWMLRQGINPKRADGRAAIRTSVPGMVPTTSRRKVCGNAGSGYRQ